MVLRSGTERIGASGNNNNDNNNGPLPDPPIQPTLADVLTQQTELFGHIVNQMGNNGNQGQREESQVNKFGDFFRTNPPIFRGSKDPLDVDFWLNTIEEKLGFIQCDQYEKVLFVAHQLHDASGMPPELGGGVSRLLALLITASLGRNSGRHFSLHIPKGIMDIKKEFLNLT